MKKVFLLIGVYLLFAYVNVFAEKCSNTVISNLQKQANEIKVNYEIVEKKVKIPNWAIEVYEETEQTNDTVEITTEEIKIIVTNITKDIYIIQINEKTKEKKTIKYDDTKNGVYSFIDNDLRDYVNYKFEVYSNISTCDTMLVKTIDFKKPKLNPNSDFPICIENPNIPVCQRYITSDNGIKVDNLNDYVEKYLKEHNSKNNSSTKKDTKETINKNNLIYIIAGVLMVGGISTYLIISKKRSRL